MVFSDEKVVAKVSGILIVVFGILNVVSTTVVGGIVIGKVVSTLGIVVINVVIKFGIVVCIFDKHFFSFSSK